MSPWAYLFSTRLLREVLEQDARSLDLTHDFGRNVLPAMVGRYALFYYRFHGYWRDVGTVESYWRANMDFLADTPPFELDGGERGIYIRHQDRPPASFGPEAVVRQSLVSNGCVIKGAVRCSILSRGVKVEEGATVEDSILLDGVVIKRGAIVDHSVLDEEAVIEEGAVVGYGDDSLPIGTSPKVSNAASPWWGGVRWSPKVFALAATVRWGLGPSSRTFPHHAAPQRQQRDGGAGRTPPTKVPVIR